MIGPKTKMVLQRRTDTVGTTGSVAHVWSDLRTIRGTLLTGRSVSNRESNLYNKITANSTHTFVCDYQIGTTVTSADRLKEGSNFYDVLFVSNPGNTSRHTEMFLQLRDDGSGATS